MPTISTKLGLLTGVGVGYVLGARAGRERYERLAGQAREWWQDPRMQERAAQVRESAAQAAEEAMKQTTAQAGHLTEVVKERVGGGQGEASDGSGAGAPTPDAS